MNIEGRGVNFLPEKGGSGSFSDERSGEEARREVEERRKKDQEIVSSVEAMKKLGGELPYIPDIRMESKKEDPRMRENGNDRKEWEDREKDNKYFRTDAYFRELVKELRKPEDYAKGVAEKKKKGEMLRDKEKIGRIYEGLQMSELGQLKNMLDETLMRYRNPHPYDSRQPEGWFAGQKTGIEDAWMELVADSGLKEKEKKENEAILKTLKRDYLWGRGTFSVMEGLGPVVGSYWSGVSMMKTVKMFPRKDPEATDYERAFSKELSGLEVEEGKSLLPEGMKEGLREKAIKFQDENAYWRMSVSAVEQLDYRTGKEPTFMKLGDKEVEFIQLLFGEEDKDEWLEYKGDKFPKGINNFYTMDTIEDKVREYQAMMGSLLTLGIKEKLEKMGEGGNLLGLVKDVKEDAQLRSKSWYDMNSKRDSLLAEVVVKSGIVYDWGHMAAFRLGWGWKYEVDEDTNEVKRSRNAGGTTSATDIDTPGDWLESHLGNTKKGWTAGGLPEVSDVMRKVVSEHEPGFKLNEKNDKEDDNLKMMEKEFNKNKKFRRILERLWQPEEKKQWTEEQKKWLEDNMWYWDTGIKSKTGVRIVLPIFFPPEMPGINYWETISLEEEDEEGDEGLFNEEGKKNKVTVWDGLVGGKKMSEFNWVKMKNQGVNRWMITLGQTLEQVTLLLEPKNGMNKETFDKFFTNEDSLVELQKRVSLGQRDGKDPKSMLEMSFISLVVTLRKAQTNKILGSSGDSLREQGHFIEQMSRFWKEAKDLPKKEDDFTKENYGWGVAKMIAFYTFLLSEMGYVLGENKKGSALKNYSKFRKDTKNSTGRDYMKIDV